ncbi:MAG: cobyrinate a,c-diamide synthase, partial [Actinophytocola sp.]|nr:cobyrinate a,c-diamide synthase [Actinophytocola sp.]
MVVAGTHSGVGKTTVATGLMAALGRRGQRVAGFKVGPDFIDPSYHALATGRPGRNLDPFLCGEDLIAPLFAHGAAGADLAVVEGVMGLFDGRSGSGGFASTAHVARLLDAPVVLVVDARGMADSLTALVSGFRDHDPAVRLAGVVLNQVGSARHEAALRAALSRVPGLPVLGVLGRHDDLVTPSRHLGLVPVAERPEHARRIVRALGERIAIAVDLAAVERVAAATPPLAALAWSPPRA